MATQTKEITCTVCKLDFVVDVPEHEIVNADKTSMVIMIHDRECTCQHCGTKYQFHITGLKQIQYGWRAVQDETISSEHAVILPPTGSGLVRDKLRLEALPELKKEK